MASDITAEKLSVNEIIKRYIQGSTKHFNSLASSLVDPNVKDAVLLEGLRRLRECVSLLEKEHFEHFVDAMLKIKWASRERKVVRAYQCFVEDLVSANTCYLQMCLSMIIKQFQPVMTPQELENVSDETKKQHDNTFINLHPLLKFLLEKVPLTETVIIQFLTEYYPAEFRNTYLIECYMQNLLRLTTYALKLRRKILELIVSRLNKVDGRCSREAIADADSEDDKSDDEDEMEEDEEMFEMEIGQEKEKEKPEEKLEEHMKHVDGNKMDILMHYMFAYIKRVCHNDEGKLDWDATKDLYRDLLAAFQNIILPTHGACHIQFLLFYIVSFKAPLAEGFIDFLWKRVQNVNEAPIFRQTAITYLASLLARAKFIDIQTVKACLDLMVGWIHRYIRIGTQTHIPDINKHKVFYAVCQATFYIFVFKHKQLLALDKGEKICQGWHLQTIVTSRLNPLRVCLPIVAQTFASIAREHQLAYCDPVLEHNQRNNIPIAGENAATKNNPLTTFFPFDPYLLKRSGTEYVIPIYVDYEGAVAEEVETTEAPMEDLDEEYDQEPESKKFELNLMEIAMSPPSASPLVKYSESPGFKTISAIR